LKSRTLTDKLRTPAHLLALRNAIRQLKILVPLSDSSGLIDLASVRVIAPLDGALVGRPLEESQSTPDARFGKVDSEPLD